ncbi:MAG: type II 3-dehydroquinate dehydratase [Myxococcota bacterium]
MDLSKSAAPSDSSRLRILVINGPNLNLLGTREPDVYGTQTLADIETELSSVAQTLGVEIACYQSNHEGELIDRIQLAMGKESGILINPGGFTHSSVALRDALVAVSLPIVEVHLSNVYARESFRQSSYVSPIAMGVISGLGAQGYLFGLEALVRRLKAESSRS